MTDAGPQAPVAWQDEQVSSPADAGPGWVLDELSSAGRENLDPVHAARYDAKEDARGPEEVELLQRLGLDRDSVVVDLGAGTGQFAIEAAASCRRVIAVDVSAIMLDRLRLKVHQSGTTNVEVVQAGFLTYEHRGQPADVVYSRYALHHLPDFWKAVALHRVRGMLRPGGIFRLWDVVYDFEPRDAARGIEAWCATGEGDIEADWTRAELEEHVRDEYSTFTWLLEPMIERSGFEIMQADHSADGILARYVACAV